VRGRHRAIVPLIALGVGLWLLGHGSGAAIDTPRDTAAGLSGPSYGGVFRRMLGDSPSTLDPAFLTDIYGRAVVAQIFDGLVQLDAHLKPIPAIAELWEASRDGRTWTFFLRRGVRFHNGREVTAHDFVYSFTRLLRVNSPSHVADLFRRVRGANDFLLGKSAAIAGLQALARYTLQIALDEPFAPSLAVLGLAHAAVVPREEVERLGEDFGRAPVGTGPFTFVRWRAQREIVLQVNADYYEGRPFLDAVVMKLDVGSQLEKRFDEFLKGNLEETIIPSAKAAEVHTDPRYQVYQHFRKPTLSLVYIGFNTRMSPFDDRRVRQAFNYAVDKEAIVRSITRRGSIPAIGVLPPGMLGYDADLPRYPYTPARARSLLAEAGYPEGRGLPVIQLWSVFKADSTKAELEAYQRALAAVGVRVNIQFAPDWPTYRAMLQQGQLPMFLLSWFADFPDPDNFFTPLLHSNSATNRTFYYNPEVDALIERAKRKTEELPRIALYRALERIVLDDAPWITHYYPVFEYLYQPYVQGIEVSLLGERAIPLKKVWFNRQMTGVSSGVEPHVQPTR
jgi:oligopeptide transport system substrate-binding protein